MSISNSSSDPPPPYRSALLINTLRVQPSTAPIEHSPAPHDRTQSFQVDRRSLSDLSLHTIRRATLTKAQRDRIQGINGTVDGVNKNASGSTRAGIETSEIDDNASFWTARSTIRSSVHARDESGDINGESARGDGTGVEQEVLVLIHEPATSSGTEAPPAKAPSEAGTLPSRFIYLFHPPEPPAASSSSGNGLANLTSAWDGLHLDPWDWLDSAKEAMERAFWGMLMPSVRGLVDMGEAVVSLPLILTMADHPGPALSGINPDSSRDPELYVHETIYTLRMPRGLDGNTGDLDLGPTLRPVIVPKRAGLPTWEGRREDEVAWGRGRMYI